MGVASLHASIIQGGRELSSYPDRCRLELERRTICRETDARVMQELAAVLDGERAADPEFDASLRMTLARPPYAIAESASLPQALSRASARCGLPAPFASMSFWTDAAVLGSAGIPTVLFGPPGAGLHSAEEYVEETGVMLCRDALVALARDWLSRKPE
jgi:acetylornithine deacetylase